MFRPGFVAFVKNYGWLLLAALLMVWGAHKAAQGGIWGFLFR